MSGIRTRNEVVWHDVECGAYEADLPLWRELAAQAGADRCELLELGCGTGRVALPLAVDHHVTALDTDPDLVEALARRAAGRGLKLEAIVADARSFTLGRSFDLVLAPMQLVQLLHGTEERTAMLAGVRSHLRPGGVAALALLALEDEWTASPDEAPFPDLRELEGWTYASRPVAVRRVERGAGIVLERVRQTVSPAGEVQEELAHIQLELVRPEQLEQEALALGFKPLPSREIAPTQEHVGSTVVVLEGP